MEVKATCITIGRTRPLAGKGPEAESVRAGGPARAFRAPRRRRFTTAYKLLILRQAERAVAEGPGALQALLAREGLYSSHLAEWRKRKRQGSLNQARRGRKAQDREALLRENRELRRKLAVLEAELRETAAMIKPPRERGQGSLGHAGAFIRHKLLNLAEHTRKARCGDEIRAPAPAVS
jgi:hypothetical protein